MQKAIWEQSNGHGRGYIYIGGDGRYNAYLRCACTPKQARYKHFLDEQKAISWLSKHLAKFA